MFPIVFLEHPPFLGSHSMTRFASMLAGAFAARGHPVQRWSPRARCHARFQGTRLAKWAGYVDQYLLFPHEVRERAAQQPADTLFVFCDQALGPWVPLLAARPHVVHCHDLLALRSALGEFPGHRTGWSGRVYQRWIRAGFRRARHLVCVSRSTQAEMRRLGGFEPASSDVVYNGLDPAFVPRSRVEAEALVRAAGLELPADGFVLHVGSGSWYKNRAGVVRLYADYARACAERGSAALPLVMIGPPPDAAMRETIDALGRDARVVVLDGLSNDALAACYALARAFVFPSLAEGFGWPIAEALACGCPVLTTGEAPMTEVGADAAVYLPPLRAGDEAAWARAGAQALQAVLDAPADEAEQRRQRGLAAVRRFGAAAAIDAYAAVYARVQSSAQPSAAVPREVRA